MKKERAQIMMLVLEAVYNRLDDVSVGVFPLNLVEYAVSIDESGVLKHLYTVQDCIEQIRELTD